MKFSRQSKPRRSDELIPMINVVFLLLIFFMVAGSLRSVEPVAIEEPTSERVGSSATQTELLISPDGAMYLNGQFVQVNRLRSELDRMGWFTARADALLAVKVDKSMSMQAFSEAVTRLRLAGVQRVNLVTARARETK